MKKHQFSKTKTFFTSDTHFGHSNIIWMCKRPYKDVEEMNQALINNWNSVISDDDTVFHLGDFAFGGSALWNGVLDQLNGKIILIQGNHDRANMRQGFMNRFELVTPQMQIEIDGRTVYLNHYPFLCYGGSYRGEENAVWALSGHTHITKKDNNGKDFERLKYLFPTQYDVGVDFNDYKPLSFQEISDKINFQVQNNVNLMYWVKS